MTDFRRPRWLVVPLVVGCAAKSAVVLIKAEQAVYQAKVDGAPEMAVYEWTHAEQYIKKAREEWGTSDYEVANHYANKAEEWAEKADEKARQIERNELLEQMPEAVPDQVDQPPADDPAIEPKQEKLQVPTEDDLDTNSGAKGD